MCTNDPQWVKEQHTVKRHRKFQSFLRYHHKKVCLVIPKFSPPEPLCTAYLRLKNTEDYLGLFTHSFATWLGHQLKPLRSRSVRSGPKIDPRGMPDLTLLRVVSRQNAKGRNATEYVICMDQKHNNECYNGVTTV